MRENYLENYDNGLSLIHQFIFIDFHSFHSFLCSFRLVLEDFV